jgi:predicted ATPase/DNA-binding CsgD family transcriptional regulator
MSDPFRTLTSVVSCPVDVQLWLGVTMSTVKQAVGNLPEDASSFVGRRADIAQARKALSQCRLVSLVGVGGVGKTRLALRVAADVRRAFPDGVWLVQLAPLVDQTFVARTVSAALGLRDESTRPPEAVLADYVTGKRLLLVLDNCEHVVDSAAMLARNLLSAAAELRILVTSREPLCLTGEKVLPVPPLTVPDLEEPVRSPLSYEAVALFADRAQAVRPDFTITPDNAGKVARLCQRLDGIPLAIELAAVRLRALSLDDIQERLHDRFRLLANGQPVAVPRQRTLRAMIDWSYDLCSQPERLLWARLSVFTSGCDLAGAEQVCAGDRLPADDIVPLLVGLVDKSIIEMKPRGDRYQMLETLRQYGLELLTKEGEYAAVRRRHRDYHRRLFARAEQEWFGPHQMEWISRLRPELAELRTALDFCVTEPGEARAGMAIAASLWSHRLAWVSLEEGRYWLDRFLALDREPTSTRAKALWVGGWLRLLQGELAAGRRMLDECRDVATRIGDKTAIAFADQYTGLEALFAGDYARAEPLLEQAIQLHRDRGDVGHAWVALFQLAMAEVFGDRPRAAELAQKCLDLADEHAAEWSHSYGLWIVGVDQLRRGEARAAAVSFQDSLRLKRACNDRLGMAQCLEGLAWATAASGRHQHAARLLGAADMMWRLIGSSLAGLGHIAAGHDQCASALTESLGAQAYSAEMAKGGELTLDEALAYALAEKEPTPQPVSSPDAEAALTPREWEVAQRVADGLSNKEIADSLLISRRTAESHIEHIFTKLGFTSRAQIAARVTAELSHAEAPRRDPPQLRHGNPD